MAIIGPEQLPVVLKLRSDPTKFEALATLGHPVVYIEIEDSQLEQAIRTAGDFIAQYFYLEERYAVFYTNPLENEYDFRDIAPQAYWIKDVKWDPVTTQISDIFGAECIEEHTNLSTPQGDLQMRDLKVGSKVHSIDRFGRHCDGSVVALKRRLKHGYRLTTEDGHRLFASARHGIFTRAGWKPLEQIGCSDHLYVPEEARWTQVKQIREHKLIETIDIQVEPYRNFIASGVVVHNSFLFCWPGGSHVLTNHGPMTCEDCYERGTKDDKLKLVTPFGSRKFKMRWNDKQQPMTMLRTENDYLACTPNHPVNCANRFKMVSFCDVSENLLNSNDKQIEILDKSVGKLHTAGTWSIQTSSGCYYASALGHELFLVH